MVMPQAATLLFAGSIPARISKLLRSKERSHRPEFSRGDRYGNPIRDFGPLAQR